MCRSNVRNLGENKCMNQNETIREQQVKNEFTDNRHNMNGRKGGKRNCLASVH